MQLNANAVSIIDKTKAEFENNMKEKLINSTFRNIVTNAIPLRDGEMDKINNPEFKSKFSEVLSEVSKGMVDQFSNVAQFDTGNLFTSMVTSITDSVSLEADYRQNSLIQKIRLGRIDQNSYEALATACYECFNDTDNFTSKEVKHRFNQDVKFILSTEDAQDVIEKIKEDVKDAIEETEAKNDLVEGTTQEIIDYKEEIAPPEDEYEQPTDEPEEGDGEDGAETGGEEDDVISDAGDEPEEGDGGAEDDTDSPYEGDQDGTDDGTGTDETYTGEEGDEDIGGEDDTGEDGDVTEGESDDTADMGDGTEDEGDDLSSDENVEGSDDDGPVGGEDGVVDEGDIGKTVDDPSMGAPAPDTGSSEPAVTDGNTNNNSGGITININGADLKATKEALNLLTPISLAKKAVPLHPEIFNNTKLPNVEVLSSECVNAGEGVEKEIKYRLDGLKYALKQSTLSTESKDAISEKINNYGKVIADSLDKAKFFEKSLENAGLTVNGLIYSNENTLCIARNIITRFLTGKQFVSPTVRPYTSKENVFANAFDIVQLRQFINKKANPKKYMVDDLIARENVFYHNMINFNDAEVKKQATAIIDLSAMNFKKAMSPNFITDYKIKSWELNVGEKSNKEVNEEVVKRVKEKFEKLWMRELNDEEMKIIRGAANQEDVTELVPNPYEKFLITMTKESIMARGSEDPSVGVKLTKEEKRDIEWKSRLMTTVYKTAESFGMINKYDPNGVDKFINTWM